MINSECTSFAGLRTAVTVPISDRPHGSAAGMLKNKQESSKSVARFFLIGC
jgi:hypothetical protein